MNLAQVHFTLVSLVLQTQQLVIFQVLKHVIKMHILFVCWYNPLFWLLLHITNYLKA